MNMSTAYLLAGYGFAIAGLWQGTLSHLVGGYYIGAFILSTLLAGVGYGWYAAFAVLDLTLAALLHYLGYGVFASAAAAVLVTSACITAYAGREGGFLYQYYDGIGGILNVLFIWFVIWQMVSSS